MRASHVALLSLAAATAAPVFAVPIPHLRARSNDGGAGLSARDSRDGMSEEHKPQSRPQSRPHDDDAQRAANRKAVNHFISTVASVNGRGYNVQQEARSSSDNAIDVVERGAPDQLLARTTVEDFANSIMSRNSNHEQQMQARNELDDLISVLNSRSDTAHDDSDAARGNFNDFMKILNSRRSTVDDIVNAYVSKIRISARDSSPQKETKARSDDSGTAFLKALLNSRDLTPDELAGRNSVDDIVNTYMSKIRISARDSSPQHETKARSDDSGTAFLKALLNSRDLTPDELSGRNSVDDIVNTYMSKIRISARDSSPQKETKARSDDSGTAFLKALLNSRDLTPDELAGRNTVDDIVNTYMSGHFARESSSQKETQARSYDSDAFLKAILNSRDLSGRLNTDEVLKILTSRAMDDLD